MLITVAGCSSADDSASAAVPSPDAKATKRCRELDEALPAEVDGQDRRDPEPSSALTAGWGNPAIILRCGVQRPAAMNDPDADGVDVNGVGWLLQEQDDGAFRFTTTLREAYVEVTIPKDRTGDGMAPLVDLASAVKKAIPEGIAN
ncbi:lipoprotein [Streptomyces sp. MMG1533]|nr:lipoprotein [Streptomyces sp. MMG1533]